MSIIPASCCVLYLLGTVFVEFCVARVHWSGLLLWLMVECLLVSFLVRNRACQALVMPLCSGRKY